MHAGFNWISLLQATGYALVAGWVVFGVITARRVARNKPAMERRIAEYLKRAEAHSLNGANPRHS